MIRLFTSIFKKLIKFKCSVVNTLACSGQDFTSGMNFLQASMNRAQNNFKTEKKMLKLSSLVFCAVVPAVLNILAISFLSPIPMRSVRLISTGLFLIYYTFFISGRNEYVVAILIALVARDFFYIHYEKDDYDYYFFAFSILSYILLLIKQWRKLIKYKFQTPSLLVGALLTFAFAFMLIQLEEIASPEFREPGITYAFYIFGSAIIALLLSSLYYYYRVGSRRSIIFCFLAYSWLITDVASCFAYYVSVYEMYYLERIAYVASLFLLINYGLNTGLLDRERKHSIEYSE